VDDLRAPPAPLNELPRLVRAPNAEPIPGYRLIERLGSGGFGEVWKCEAPGGLFKAIKFVLGQHTLMDGDNALAEQELLALQRVKIIRHPFLLSLERVELVGVDLVIVMELADTSLDEVLHQHQAKGLAGIPRDLLLGYLLEAAEALDLLNLQYQLQHLDVKPRNLFLLANHVKVGDFGLLQSLSELNNGGGGAGLGGMTPLYTPPEVLLGAFSRHSDQYSLAIVYQELLTGKVPFGGENERQVAMQHLRAEPDLELLPPNDRAVVARALAKEPEKRFASCLDFVRSLRNEGGRLTPRVVTRPAWPIHKSPELLGRPANAPEPSLAETTAIRRSDDGEDTRVASPEPPPTADARTTAGAHEVLPGYRFLTSLGSNATGETWVVQVPDGRKRFVRFVFGLGSPGTPDEQEVARQLTALSDDVLMPFEVLRCDPGRLVLISDLPEKTLRERLAECQAQRQAGIPRLELLRYLGDIAEALDTFREDQQLQHLALHPGSILLYGGETRLADFGLAQYVWLPAGHPVGQLNTRYAAPELIEGRVSPSCDQYSLAVIFLEMLTGLHPFRGQSRPRRGGSNSRGVPNLALLTPADREIMTRALDPNPERRFRSCGEFIAALEAGLVPHEAGSRGETQRVTSSELPGVIPWPPELPLRPSDPASAPPLTEILQHLLGNIAGSLEIGTSKRLHYLLYPGPSLEHRCGVRLVPSSTRLKIEGFLEALRGHLVDVKPDCFTCHFYLRGSFWQECVGRRRCLELQVQLKPGEPGGLTEVKVTIRPVGYGKEQGWKMLREKGPVLLDKLRTYLQASPEQRSAPRLPCRHTAARLFPVEANVGMPRLVECQVKDISAAGIGLLLPSPPTVSELYVNLPASAFAASLAILARVTRIRPLGDGLLEVGARFPSTEPASPDVSPRPPGERGRG
jgi:serine/threonine protein kinase